MTLEKHIKELENILDESCDEVSSIKEINDRYDYEDEFPQGGGDSDLVACGQKGNYNELKYIYKTKLLPYIKDGKISKDDAIKALCKVCRDLKPPRNRGDFYDQLQDHLSINIE